MQKKRSIIQLKKKIKIQNSSLASKDHKWGLHSAPPIQMKFRVAEGQ